MFLVRPRPLDGESLSSWRQFSGTENGFRLYPLHAELRRSDPDMCGDVTLNWLSREFDIEPGELRSLTLRRYEGTVFRILSQRRPDRWVVPLRYTQSAVQYGPAYCADCLREEPRPFFRLQWRLAFITECTSHECELRERCPDCAHLVWPHTATQAPLYARKSSKPADCAYCGFDLSRLRASKADATTSRVLDGYACAPTVTLSSEHVVPTLEYFEALATVCQLFVRRGPASRIRSSSSQWSGTADLLVDNEFRQVEALDVTTRRILVGVASKILSDWPNQFLSFATETDLSHQHFCDAGTVVPHWMQLEVDRHLRLQRRGVTVPQVHSAVAALRTSGTATSMAAVRRLLNCGDATAVRQLLSRRWSANQSEMDSLAGALTSVVAGHDRRRSSRMARLRNVGMVCASVVLRRGFDHLLTQTIAELVQACRDATIPTPSGQRLQDLAVQALEESRSLAVDLWGSEAGTRLGSVRGKCAPRRAAQKCLMNAMRSADPRLERSTRVFYGLVREVDVDTSRRICFFKQGGDE